MLAETLSDIFQRGLEFAYDCEQHLIKTLPKFVESVRSPDLKAAFERQAEESKQQLTRLDEVFASLNRAAATENNRSIESILAEGEKLIKHIDSSPLRDAALIITGNLVQHNEIALYGSLTALAKVLGFESAAGLLEKSLNEAKATDQELIDIAVKVNQEAVGFQNKPHGFVII
jgi:ferritin-like metal-binding protein YciE